jgi:hypothetical protein
MSQETENMGAVKYSTSNMVKASEVNLGDDERFETMSKEMVRSRISDV